MSIKNRAKYEIELEYGGNKRNLVNLIKTLRASLISHKELSYSKSTVAPKPNHKLRTTNWYRRVVRELMKYAGYSTTTNNAMSLHLITGGVKHPGYTDLTKMHKKFYFVLGYQNNIISIRLAHKNANYLITIRFTITDNILTVYGGKIRFDLTEPDVFDQFKKYINGYVKRATTTIV